MFEQYHPVKSQLIRTRFSDELFKVFLLAEDRVVETSIDKGITVTFETFVNDLKDADALFRRDILHIGLQHFLGDYTFHIRERYGSKVFVGGHFQAISGSLDLCLVLAFQSSQHGRSVGDAHKVQTRHQCFLNGLLVIEGRAAMLNDTAYLVECFLIRIIPLFASAGKELFLLGTFCVEYFQADKPFVHANGIFPIIGRRGILAGIMDAYSRIFLHLFHQNLLANTTYMMAHEISGLHTFFHFVGNHIAPVASGESHDESKVAFFVAGKADGKMLLHFQGNIILGIFHRISVLVGIYAEQREVTCMPRPHPVIGIRTEFSYRGRRCTYHTDVTVSGFNKQVITVTTIESFQFELASRCQGNALFGREALGYFLQVFGRQVVCTVGIRIYL